MKSLTLFISAILVSSLIYSQELQTIDSTRNPETKTRKELRKEKLEADYLKTKSIIDSLQFVLEADWLSNQWGSRVSVSSSLNFIMVDSSQAIIQTGNNFSMGRNGVGGTTATGNITKFLVTKDDKKKSISIRMDVSTSIGYYNIFMDINASGSATATMSGMTMGRLIYYGKIKPLEASYAFKGRSF
jgi:hypothetical protein